MAISSSRTHMICFLEHQLVKPMALILVIAIIGIVGWIGVDHMTQVQARAGDQAAGSGSLLGIQIVNPDELVARMFSLPPMESVLINHVIQDSPAHRAGLRRGDGIVAIDGQATRSTGDVATYLDHMAPGDLLQFTVIRGGLLHDLMIPFGGQGGGL